MSANFEQISGPNGLIQKLTASSSPGTALFNPKSLKGLLPGGDYLYCDRFRCRISGTMARTTGDTDFAPLPNWQQMAQAFKNVRVWSPFLGEVYNKTMTSVPLLANHDAFFANGFQQHIRERGILSGSSGNSFPVEYEFPIYFMRKYLTSPQDSSIWLPLFEGGQIEIDQAPSDAFATMFGEAGGWLMTGDWSYELVADWTPDRQACIHTPIRSSTYRVVTTGPEYVLKAVGATNGLDGVVKGCRLPVLSWLGAGDSLVAGFHDNGFYNSFAQGGVYFGILGAGGVSAGGDPHGGNPNVVRIDVPFRDQRSITAVSAWIASFLDETAAIRHMPQLWTDTGEAQPTLQTTGVGTGGIGLSQNDLMGWPYARDSRLTEPAFLNNAGGGNFIQSEIISALDFWPFVWPQEGQKIVDAQKVDGDLMVNVDLKKGPSDSILNLFRSDEICSFSAGKVMDIMERMGLPHVSRGGGYIFVPKYAGMRRASDSTQWGLPLKIIEAPKKT